MSQRLLTPTADLTIDTTSSNGETGTFVNAPLQPPQSNTADAVVKEDPQRTSTERAAMSNASDTAVTSAEQTTGQEPVIHRGVEEEIREEEENTSETSIHAAPFADELMKETEEAAAAAAPPLVAEDALVPPTAISAVAVEEEKDDAENAPVAHAESRAEETVAPILPEVVPAPDLSLVLPHTLPPATKPAKPASPPSPATAAWVIDFGSTNTNPKRRMTKKEKDAIKASQQRNQATSNSSAQLTSPVSAGASGDTKGVISGGLGADSEGNNTVAIRTVSAAQGVSTSALPVIPVEGLAVRESLIPTNLATTRADLEQRMVLRMPRVLCVNKQYPRGCGMASLTSVYNYLYSCLGEGEVGKGKPPHSQEELMSILGFEPPFGEIPWGPFTGNATLIRWFHALNRHFGHQGRAYILYKAHGQGKTTHLYPDNAAALVAVKVALRDPHCALIYHCHNHYMVPVGYQEIPHAQTDFLKPQVPSENCDTTIFIGEVSRGRHEAMYARRWELIVKDLECKSPFFFNIRHPDQGVQRREPKGKSAAKTTSLQPDAPAAAAAPVPTSTTGRLGSPVSGSTSASASPTEVHVAMMHTTTAATIAATTTTTDTSSAPQTVAPEASPVSSLVIAMPASLDTNEPGLAAVAVSSSASLTAESSLSPLSPPPVAEVVAMTTVELPELSSSSAAPQAPPTEAGAPAGEVPSPCFTEGEQEERPVPEQKLLPSSPVLRQQSPSPAAEAFVRAKAGGAERSRPPTTIRAPAATGSSVKTSPASTRRTVFAVRGPAPGGSGAPRSASPLVKAMKEAGNLHCLIIFRNDQEEMHLDRYEEPMPVAMCGFAPPASSASSAADSSSSSDEAE